MNPGHVLILCRLCRGDRKIGVQKLGEPEITVIECPACQGTGEQRRVTSGE